MDEPQRFAPLRPTDRLTPTARTLMLLLASLRSASVECCASLLGEDELPDERMPRAPSEERWARDSVENVLVEEYRTPWPSSV